MRRARRAAPAVAMILTLILVAGASHADEEAEAGDPRPAPRANAGALAAPELATTRVAEVQLGPGEGAPTPRFSADGRWLVVPQGARRDAEIDGWTYAAFRLVNLDRGVLAHTEDALACGPQAPVFDRASRVVAWGERRAPGRLRIHVRSLADGATSASDIEHRVGRGYTVLAAVAARGARVAVVEPGEGRRRRSLLVTEPGRASVSVRREDFAGPSQGPHRFAVDLLGPLVIHHTRTPNRGGGRDYRLVVFDAAQERLVATLGAWASRATPRFALSPGGDRLLNGDADFDLETLELGTLETRRLANVRRDLYSHWLELTLDPTGRRLAAWSDERRRAVVIDLADGQRRDVDRPGRIRLLGFDPAGEHLVLVQGTEMLEVVEINSGHILATRPVTKPHVFLDPTGRCLVTAREASKGWSLHLEHIAWDDLRTDIKGAPNR